MDGAYFHICEGDVAAHANTRTAFTEMKRSTTGATNASLDFKLT
jgi:hypothetical protein